MFITALISLSILILEFHNSIDNQVSAQTYPYVASTKGSFDLDYGTNIQQANLPSPLHILNIDDCPTESAIYVHGVWATEEQAEEQTDRVSLSLEKIGYDIPLIGFIWDSNTPFSLDNLQLSMYGWGIAKIIANSNGPLLGKFIQQFKENCPNDDVRIIAHSLGSRVTVSSIQWLHENSNFNEPKKLHQSIYWVLQLTMNKFH